MEIALAIVVVWLLCGVVAAGFSFAYFQRKYPTLANSDRSNDLRFAWTSGILGGPITLVVAYFYSGRGKHGWALR